MIIHPPASQSPPPQKTKKNPHFFFLFLRYLKIHCGDCILEILIQTWREWIWELKSFMNKFVVKFLLSILLIDISMKKWHKRTKNILLLNLFTQPEKFRWKYKDWKMSIQMSQKLRRLILASGSKTFITCSTLTLTSLCKIRNILGDYGVRLKC